MIAFLSNSIYFGAMLTIAAYGAALLIRRRFKLAVLNPILLSTLCVIGVLCVTNVPYDSYAQSAGLLSKLLTPATVCLAVPLYEKLHLLKAHWKAVLVGLVCGVGCSAVCIWLLCLLFRLPHQMYVTLLPKSITTAIGIGVSEELGGIASLTVASIILTGIFGNICAERVFHVMHIHEPIAKGLAIGASSHALGTVRALEMGEVEGAMSSLALVVCGLFTVIVAPLFGQLI